MNGIFSRDIISMYRVICNLEKHRMRLKTTFPLCVCRITNETTMDLGKTVIIRWSPRLFCLPLSEFRLRGDFFMVMVCP